DDGLVKIPNLHVGTLTRDGALLVVDPLDGEPKIELRGDSVYVQNAVCADKIRGRRLVGQKLQTTPGDPADDRAPVFGEVAVNEDGGAYLALLSPKETHSLTMGFDKTEKGCVISQNNEDSAMVAQAIFLKPVVESAAPAAPAVAKTAAKTQDEVVSPDPLVDSFDDSAFDPLSAAPAADPLQTAQSPAAPQAL
ncbi:MAG: hypothetical protein HUK22_08710, partial [Thermoguttaceae bacterium]|nr:hypothetical protein [Thermoguttaceae bacterium]